MYPLNGPSWSLFFEYIGNLPLRLLHPQASPPGHSPHGCALAGLPGWRHSPCGALTATSAWGSRWTGDNILGGSLRLLFAFSAGLLLSRVQTRAVQRRLLDRHPGNRRRSVPRIGGSEHLWMNGLYDTFCAIVLFPLIVYIGASGRTTDRLTARVCKFLGDISYPLYMVHYPFIYLYYAWVRTKSLTFAQSLPGALALVAGSVLLAYLCLKLYDEPVRRFLTDRFLRRGE